MSFDSSAVLKVPPSSLYEPTTATACASAACWAHCETATESLCSLQVSTLSLRPLSPPVSLT